MAQHIPIQNFRQKAMQRIEQNIRKQRYFGGSLKYEKLPEEYKEHPKDEVFITSRTVPKNICWFKPTIEVHTDPTDRHERIATNIYVIL